MEEKKERLVEAVLQILQLQRERFEARLDYLLMVPLMTRYHKRFWRRGKEGEASGLQEIIKKYRMAENRLKAKNPEQAILLMEELQN